MFTVNSLKQIYAFIKLAIFVLILTACSGSENIGPSAWPSLGDSCAWMNIDIARLTPANSEGLLVELDPFFSAQMPFDFYLPAPGAQLQDRNLRNGIEHHHYPHLMVVGHYFGSGTHVYFLPEDKVFYLWGDDYMDHSDGMVGPFLGDPRKELRMAASPVELLPEMVVMAENCE